MSDHPRLEPLTIHIGPDELVIRRRYEAASTLNDILIALWFVVGSALFFSKKLAIWADWCFLIGSIQFLARPVIRFSRQLHLQRVRAQPGGDFSEPGRPPTDSSQDY